jgi:hypothetical protein
MQMNDIIQQNCLYEFEGLILVHNYPPKRNTVSYITLKYREFDEDQPGFIFKVESKPIYFYELSPELEALAKCIGEAQNIISKRLHDKFLNENSIF